MSNENLYVELANARSELSLLTQEIKRRSAQQTHKAKEKRKEIARLLTKLNKAGK